MLEECTQKEVEATRAYNANLLNPFELRQSLTTLQILKVVLTSVLLPLRVASMLWVLSAAWLLCVLTLLALPEEEARGLEPLSGWRRRWAKPFLSRMCRFVFFLGGFVWAPQRGRRATRKEAPILLVVPHSSFLDTALVTLLHCPGLVVKDFTARAPFFGDLIRYTQPLFVSSEDPESRRRIAEDIRRRVQSDKDFEQLMLFPEGGCGNRKALLHFKLGAFNPGVPVQPVFVRYPNDLDTITWTWEGPGAWNRIWLSLAQFRIHCELEFIPVYSPSEVERNNPRLFANNVQKYVSRWTGCPWTHFAVEDARFLRVADRLHVQPTAPLVKFLRLRSTIGRQDMEPTDELLFLRDRSTGRSDFAGDAVAMSEYLGLDRCPEALRDFFRTVNQKEKETLDVRIYAACLCLIRKDVKTSWKLKAAFQAFASDTESEHLATLLLLWKGIPARLVTSKNRVTFDKIQNEEYQQESRNFL